MIATILYVLPMVILAILSFFYLFHHACYKDKQKKEPIFSDYDRAALIAAYRTDVAEYPEQKEELDFRLYHELKARENGQFKSFGSLPLWTYPAIVGLFFVAGYHWYLSSGERFQAWRAVMTPLESLLLRSQYLGDLDMLQQVNPVLYCQALQQRINHHDRNQLETLGRCYSLQSDYLAAAAVYARLYLLYPDDEKIALDYAQMTLFSRPSQPMPTDVEAILLAQAKNNPVAKILLAASYTQAGKSERASALWEQLRQEIPSNSPLYRLIPAQTLEETQPSDVSPAQNKAITVTIDSDLLSHLPATARMFVTAAREGERRPLAVKALSPTPSQSFILTDDDSMSGEHLPIGVPLTFRAILSADGHVGGKRLAEVEITAKSDQSIVLELKK